MKKMLMLASVASMIQQFNMRNIHILQKMGYEVHVACNFLTGSTITKKRTEQLKKELKTIGVHCHQIDFDRNVKNIPSVKRAYAQVKTLLQQENFAFLHCHSPIGGVIGRLAGHACGVKVIYTAHGFHFFKGASVVNWTLFYPIERKLSKYTDILITINKDDYNLAKKKFTKTNVIYVPGVGINTEKFSVDEEEVAYLVKNAMGSWGRMLGLMKESEEARYDFELFVQMMRLAWVLDVKGIKNWTEQVAALSREGQIRFLQRKSARTRPSIW